MKSPKDMNIIQIELTNACVHRCANCTRFCGHHQKPFFMDMDTFKHAVDSMDGFEHMIGIMGGEPTLHPEFAEMVSYYAQKVPQKREHKPYLTPTRSFVHYRNRYLSNPTYSRGLWTSLGKKYYQHFEQIQDTFPFQCINDHQNEGLHQALLITRKELGISDEKWIPMRDQCWVQNLWSASITPKGAFFCEITAALDMLFDGPGGWPIESGWWKRKPEDFGDQLQWCELCSAALPVPRVQANSEVDVISPVLRKKLEAIGSPKLREGKILPFDPADYRLEDYQRNLNNPEWYLPTGNNNVRIQPTNDSILPRQISVFSISNEGSAPAAYPLLTEDEFAERRFSGWCVVTRIALPPLFFEAMERTVLNPGCVHYYCHSMKQDESMSADQLAAADVLVFHHDALALRDKMRLELTAEMFSAWVKEKRIPLDSFPEFAAPVSEVQRFLDYLRGTPLGPFLSNVKSKLRGKPGALNP